MKLILIELFQQRTLLDIGNLHDPVQLYLSMKH